MTWRLCVKFRLLVLVLADAKWSENRKDEELGDGDDYESN
jgi:hypothetical protein